MKFMQAKWLLVLILVSTIIITGCSEELTAKDGDKVKVHYTGTLDDGAVFDSSYEREQPLEFTVGEGKLIADFEQAVIDMQVGQSKTVIISAEDAYGLLVYEVDQDEIPPDLELEIGQQVQYYKFQCTVSEVSEATVILHNNHPLAGEDLTFDIELVEIL